MLIFVRLMTGSSLPVDIDPNASVSSLKHTLLAMHDVPVHAQRLIFAGQVMKDTSTLSNTLIEVLFYLYIFIIR